MDAVLVLAIGFGAFGFLAFVRTEKLIKTLKEKGLLDDDYKDGSSRFGEPSLYESCSWASWRRACPPTNLSFGFDRKFALEGPRQNSNGYALPMKAYLPAVPGFLLLACGLQPKNLQTHQVVASNATELAAVEDLRFGVLGNTRAAIPVVDKAGGSVISPEAPGQVMGDLLWQRQQEALDFVVLLGDMVRASRTSEWDAFDAQWLDLVEGSSASELGGARVPVLPVAGDRESILDERLTGYGASFPSFGVDIGFNRVASWGYFDQEIGGSTWRFLVVDSNKEALGSRWREQTFWLPKAAAGNYDHLLVFMHDSRVTLATDGEMNPGGVPQELVEGIEEHAGLMKLRAVFSAGSHSSEIYLPEDDSERPMWVLVGEDLVPPPFVVGETAVMPDLRQCSWSPGSTWRCRAHLWSAAPSRRPQSVKPVRRVNGKASSAPTTPRPFRCMAIGWWTSKGTSWSSASGSWRRPGHSRRSTGSSTSRGRGGLRPEPGPGFFVANDLLKEEKRIGQLPLWSAAPAENTRDTLAVPFLSGVGKGGSGTRLRSCRCTPKNLADPLMLPTTA